MKPINLNKVRKARARAADKTKADENSRRFGRTKAEKQLDTAREKQVFDRLSQHKLTDD